VFRAGADEHDRRAEVPRGDVDAVVVQAELFGGLGLCHDAYTSPRSAITHQRPVCGARRGRSMNNMGVVRRSPISLDRIWPLVRNFEGVAVQTSAPLPHHPAKLLGKATGQIKGGGFK
jgi:hypothetical protein